MKKPFLALRAALKGEAYHLHSVFSAFLLAIKSSGRFRVQFIQHVVDEFEARGMLGMEKNCYHFEFENNFSIL